MVHITFSDLRSWASEGEHGGVEAASQVEEEEVGAVGELPFPADTPGRVRRVNNLKSDNDTCRAGKLFKRTRIFEFRKRYFQELFRTFASLLGDKMILTVRLGKLFYESSTGVPALLPCSQLPRQARGTLRKLFA